MSDVYEAEVTSRIRASLENAISGRSDAFRWSL